MGEGLESKHTLNPGLNNQRLMCMIICLLFDYLNAVFMYLCMNVVRHWKDAIEGK